MSLSTRLMLWNYLKRIWTWSTLAMPPSSLATREAVLLTIDPPHLHMPLLGQWRGPERRGARRLKIPA